MSFTGRITAALQALAGKTITDPAPIVRTQVDHSDLFGSRYGRPHEYDACYTAYRRVPQVKMLVDIPAAVLAQVPLRVYKPAESSLLGSRRAGSERIDRLREHGSASVKSALSESEEVEEVTDDLHPYVALLKQWSGRHDEFSGKYGLLQHIGISGGVYLAPIQTEGPSPNRLEVLDPRYVRPNVDRDTDELIDTYSGHRDGRDHWTHDSKDIIPIGFEDPDDPTRFHGWLASSLDIASLLYWMTQSRIGFFQNGGQPGAIITGAKTEAQKKQVEGSWQQRIGDPIKAYSPLVLTEGMVAVLDKTTRDLDFNAGYQQMTETMAAAACVPMTLLQQQNANLAGAIEAHPTFAELNLGPKSRLIEDKLNERLSPLFGEGYFVAFDPLTSDDEEREARIATQLTGGPVQTVNEWRAAHGMPEVEGGETLRGGLTEEPADPFAGLFGGAGQLSLSEGDVLRVAKAVRDLMPEREPVTVREVETPALPEPAKACGCGKDACSTGTKNITWTDAAYRAVPVCDCGCDCSEPPKGTKDIDEERGFESASRQLTKDTAEWYEGLYRDVVGEIIEGGDLSESAAQAFVTDAADQLFKSQAATLDRMFSAGWSQGIGDLPPERVRVDVQVDRAAELYRENRIGVTRDIAETAVTDAQKLVDSVIESGMDEGLRVDEITRALNEKVPGLSRSRAETIARTEVSNALQQGRMDAWKESGIVEGKRYLLSSDPCPICIWVAQKNPGPIPLDQPFAKSGDSVPLPSGGTFTFNRDIMVGNSHPRCRCSSAAEIMDPGDEV
ncbi:MAG: phage portal protein [Planctomycetota bacterium]